MKFQPFGISIEDEGRRTEFIRRASAPDNGFAFYFKKAKLTYSEIREVQLNLLWRVIRAHAISKYQLNVKESLANLDDISLWLTPMPDTSPKSRSVLVDTLTKAWAGKPLLPANADNIPAYLAALQHSKELLRITYPDVLEDSIYYGLDDCENYPDKEEIIEYEYRKCAQVQDMFYDLGTNGTLLRLQGEGYTRNESEALLKLANSLAVEQISISDREYNRKIMVGRLESTIRKAREEMNVRAELTALATLAKIQGLDRDVEANPMEEFISLIRSASGNNHARAAIPAPGETWVQDDGDVGTDGFGDDPDDGRTIDVRRAIVPGTGD